MSPPRSLWRSYRAVLTSESSLVVDEAKARLAEVEDVPLVSVRRSRWDEEFIIVVVCKEWK